MKLGIKRGNLRAKSASGLAKKSLIGTILLCFVASVFLPGFALGKLNPVPYKGRVGLNVHWALGGDGDGLDQDYQDKLKQSKTKWAREHFQMESIWNNDTDAWLRRYDLIMANYKKQNIQVVGMLAYNKDHNDFRAPNETIWREFVALVVNRYKNDVNVWEIWNEPDSPTYLTPNNPRAYGQILKPAYSVIKMIDPGATVITGGLSWPNPYFIKQMYQKYGNYFDGLGLHLYYCSQYFEEGRSLNALEFDLDRARKIQKKYKSNQKIWITEMGCSTGGTGISEEMQKEYFQNALPEILSRKWVKFVLIYNIRNYDYRGLYEDHFGLLKNDMSIRPVWDWYDSLKRGPYGKKKITKQEEKVSQKKLLKKLKKKYFKNKKDRIEYLPKTYTWEWKGLKNAYIYGGYNVKQIAYSLKFGKAVSYTIPARLWKKTRDYKEVINKSFKDKKASVAGKKQKDKKTKNKKSAKNKKVKARS